jgi:hypothetical protein
VLIGRRKQPQLRKGITVEEFAWLEHVIVSLGGGGFVTPVVPLPALPSSLVGGSTRRSDSTPPGDYPPGELQDGASCPQVHYFD